MKRRKLLLLSNLSPGDTLMLTATVRDLHAAYPNKFFTDVHTTAMEIWKHNPYITKLKWQLDNERQRIETHDEEIYVLRMHYTDAINQSNQRPYHFIHGYTQYLEEMLGLKIPVTQFKGDIFLEQDEFERPVGEVDINSHYWIIINGGKQDVTTKWPNPLYMQQVVDHFKNKIKFVQCGDLDHWHPRLDNVIDMVGKTPGREFIRLVAGATGVLCPLTYAMHLAAAVPTRYENIPRFCVVIAGGREAAHWEMYPAHQYLHTIGAIDCCAFGGCWKSHVDPKEEDIEKDPLTLDYLCKYPEDIALGLRSPKCINMITPNKIIDAIGLYYDGGLGLYG